MPLFTYSTIYTTHEYLSDMNCKSVFEFNTFAIHGLNIFMNICCMVHFNRTLSLLSMVCMRFRLSLVDVYKRQESHPPVRSRPYSLDLWANIKRQQINSNIEINVAQQYLYIFLEIESKVNVDTARR